MARTLPFHLLVDFAENKLSEDERARVAALLEHDPAAAAEVARLTQLIALMRTDRSEDAPAHVVNRAAHLLRQRRPHPAAAGALRRLVAALTFDSASTPALGVRSGDVQVRQMLFSAEGVDLDIRIAPGDGGYAITGQVLGPDAPGEVVLVGAAVSLRAPLTDLGEFALSAVPAGRYALTLRQGGAEVVIPELQLGASPDSTHTP